MRCPAPPTNCGTRRRRARAAFSLIEVVLAIFIAVGIFVVVLFFYHQAAGLRTQLLEETDRLAAARLLMDRITTELRTARRHAFYETPLVGESQFLQFIKTDLPSRNAWAGAALGRVASAQTDLKLVRYGVSSAVDGTNAVILGLTRTEEPLVEGRQLADTRINFTPGDTASEEPKPPPPLTEAFRFLRFRYWDGSAWLDSWNASGLPKGVEVSLGVEPPPEEIPEEELAGDEPPPEAYPYEIFRRVIYLPGSETGDEPLVRSQTTSTNQTATATEARP